MNQKLDFAAENPTEEFSIVSMIENILDRLERFTWSLFSVKTQAFENSVFYKKLKDGMLLLKKKNLKSIVV